MKSTNLKIFWNFQVKREPLIFPLHFFFSFLHGTSFYALLILFFLVFLLLLSLYFLWCVLHLLYNFPLPLFPTFPNWLPTRSSFCLSSSLFLYLFSSVLYGNLSVIYQQSQRERERERARRREWERIKGDQSSGLEEAFASAGRARGTFFIKQEFKRTVGDFNPQTNSHRERERYKGDR